MAKVVLLVLIVLLFLQTPFFKMYVVPQYKNSEATLTKMLSGKPEDIKQRRYPATDPSHTTPSLQPVARPQAPAKDQLNSVAEFMPKKSSTSGGTRSVAGPKSKRSIFKGWNIQN